MKYDKIFFNSNRIVELLDNLLEEKEDLKVNILAELLSSYVHFRVNSSISDSSNKAVTLKIDANSLPKKNVTENAIFEGIVFLIDKLELENVSIKRQNDNITITLY